MVSANFEEEGRKFYEAPVFCSSGEGQCMMGWGVSDFSLGVNSFQIIMKREPQTSQ